ncbi:MAG: hypothetical protein ACYDD0_08520 [Candidatus Dormibacteria bacterium]
MALAPNTPMIPDRSVLAALVVASQRHSHHQAWLAGQVALSQALR